jgi:hypothetical protein
VLGGCDGLFDPSGADPLPGQEANLAFLATMLDQSQGAFDLFDLHLYADPYTIPARVETVRKAMQKAGAERPVIAAEYAGPGFFEFKANRKWFASIQGPDAGPESVRKLRAEAQAMPIETRMFLARDDDSDRRKLLRLQTEDLVVRNMLAFASGVRRTAFFDVWHELRDPDAPNDILFGSLKLLDHGANGLDRELPIAASYRRLATALAGMSTVSRLAIAGHDDVYAFRVERHGAGPLLVVWRRPAQRGGDAEPLRIDLPWQGRPRHVEAADGGAVTVSVAAHALSLEVTDMPVLIG